MGKRNDANDQVKKKGTKKGQKLVKSFPFEQLNSYVPLSCCTHKQQLCS